MTSPTGETPRNTAPHHNTETSPNGEPFQGPQAPENAAPAGNNGAAVRARVLRRETHSPRSALAITLAAIIIVACAWLGVETVIALLDRPALLAAPADMAGALAGLAGLPEPALIVVGAAAAVAGIILVIVAVTPGRRARRVLPSERSAAVAGDEVIASAVARQASYAANVAPDDTEVNVGRRSITVRIRHASGQAVDAAAVQDSASRALAAYRAAPALHARAAVTTQGKVGA